MQKVVENLEFLNSVKMKRSNQETGSAGGDLPGHQEMIGTCPTMLQVFHLIRKVAPADLPVLVTGSSGTGKEMVAQAIHERSLRNRGPLVPVNCGAIPRDLL